MSKPDTRPPSTPEPGPSSTPTRAPPSPPSTPSGPQSPPPQRSDPQLGQTRTIVLPNMARFFLLRTEEGRYSPRIDERCVTYCTQTSKGRTEGSEPQCRTVCWRTVFGHEVRGRDVPLPEQELSWTVTDENGKVVERRREVGRKWEEGSYVWSGKGTVAAWSKMEQMSQDLREQERWNAFLEKRVRETLDKAEAAKQAHAQKVANAKRQLEQASTLKESAEAQESVARAEHQQATFNPRTRVSGPNIYRLQNASASLTPVSSFSNSAYEWLSERISNLLLPTQKLYSAVQRTYENGTQARIRTLLYQAFQNGDGFKMGRKILDKLDERGRELEEQEKNEKNENPPPSVPTKP